MIKYRIMADKMVAECVTDFLEYLESRGRSKNTLVNYEVDLRQFTLYLEGEGIIDPVGIDLSTVRYFLSCTIGLGAAKSSAVRKLSAIRGFMNWLYSRGYTMKNPAAGIKGPKIPSHLPKALSYADTVKLITKGPEEGKHKRRDRLLLEIMYGSGLRVSEVVGLDWENVELEKRVFRVMGKGNKERIAPFGIVVKELLEDWRTFMGFPESGPVFTSDRGAERLTSRTVHRVVLRAAKRVGLYGVSPHTLRHCFATHMLENKAPLSVVQELLGHESMATTQKYLLITTEQIKRSYMESHPRAIGTKEDNN